MSLLQGWCKGVFDCDFYGIFYWGDYGDLKRSLCELYWCDEFAGLGGWFCCICGNWFYPDWSYVQWSCGCEQYGRIGNYDGY